MHTLIDVKFPSSFACFLASSGYEGIFCVADIIRRQYIWPFLLCKMCEMFCHSVFFAWLRPLSCCPFFLATTITVEPPLSCHPCQGTGKWLLNGAWLLRGS